MFDAIPDHEIESIAGSLEIESMPDRVTIEQIADAHSIDADYTHLSALRVECKRLRQVNLGITRYPSRAELLNRLSALSQGRAESLQEIKELVTVLRSYGFHTLVDFAAATVSSTGFGNADWTLTRLAELIDLVRHA